MFASAKFLTVLLLGATVSTSGLHSAQLQRKAKSERNVIIFVADGLRHGSVTAVNSPRMYALRSSGVDFVNSHSLFPTFTTANASAFATGHQLGDTGDFSNTIYSGYPVFKSKNFGNKPGTLTPFIEDDEVLADLDDHFSGNYLHEETLLSVARAHGYATAAIGKVGPAAIQDVTQIAPQDKRFPVPATVIIDDRTGHVDKAGKPVGVPLPPRIAEALKAQGMGAVVPGRGVNGDPGTKTANIDQQQYFADALTKSILPAFQKGKQPFVVVYWSRDPDGSQHNQGDSLDLLQPGINGPTSLAGIKNADNNLGQVLDYLKQHHLERVTDVFVVSDHGFSTITHHDLDATRVKYVDDYASHQSYAGITAGFEPPGFLAIDIAHELNLPLFSPDLPPVIGDATMKYAAVDAAKGMYPPTGNGPIGGTGTVSLGEESSIDAEIVVAANGGSDLIYLPARSQQGSQEKDGRSDLARKLVKFLTSQSYVGGLFVDDELGEIPGALPLSSIGLAGEAVTPRPAIVVNFFNFAADPTEPVNTRVEFADSTLRQGQGMHGSFSRADTFNTMMAIGPDFRATHQDRAPVSNADVALTVAQILGLQFPSKGKLHGRVIHEALRHTEALRHSQALRHGVSALEVKSRILASKPEKGVRTILHYQVLGSESYYDVACFSYGSDQDCK